MTGAVLTDRELVQLSIGAYQLIFRFDSDVTLSVEGGLRYWIDSKEGKWQTGSPSTSSALAELVGSSVSSAEVGTNNDLSLVFEAGQRVLVSGTSPDGEAYQLTSPEGVFVI